MSENNGVHMECLEEHYARQNWKSKAGPVRLVAARGRRRGRSARLFAIVTNPRRGSQTWKEAGSDGTEEETHVKIVSCSLSLPTATNAATHSWFLMANKLEIIFCTGKLSSSLSFSIPLRSTIDGTPGNKSHGLPRPAFLKLSSKNPRGLAT